MTISNFKTLATFKMWLFMIIVNGFQSLTIVIKGSILDVAEVLDPTATTDIFSYQDWISTHFKAMFHFYPPWVEKLNIDLKWVIQSESSVLLIKKAINMNETTGCYVVGIHLSQIV